MSNRLRLYYRRTKVKLIKSVSTKTGKVIKRRMRVAYGKPEKFDLRKKQIAVASMSDGINVKKLYIDMQRYRGKRLDRELVLSSIREKAQGVFEDFIKQAQRITSQRIIVAPKRIHGQTVTVDMLKREYGSGITIGMQNRNLYSPVEVERTIDYANKAYDTEVYDFKTETQNHFFYILSGCGINSFDDPDKYRRVEIEGLIKFIGLEGEAVNKPFAFEYFAEVLKCVKPWLIPLKTPSHIIYEIVKRILEKQHVSVSGKLTLSSGKVHDFQKGLKRLRVLPDYQLHIKVIGYKDLKGGFAKKYLAERKIIMDKDKKKRAIEKAERDYNMKKAQEKKVQLEVKRKMRIKKYGRPKKFKSRFVRIHKTSNPKKHI